MIMVMIEKLVMGWAVLSIALLCVGTWCTISPFGCCLFILMLYVCPLYPFPFRSLTHSGYVSSFTQTVFHGHAYERCPACSPRVVAAYEQQGPSFLLGALRDPGVLEKVTGLAEMHAAMDAMLLEEEDKVEEEGGRGKGKTEGDEEEEEDWTTL